MGTIEERLQMLEDKEAILQLLNEYGNQMDWSRDVDAFTDLFTPDGIWQGTPITVTAGKGLARMEGRKAIAEWWLRGGRDKDAYWEAGHRVMHHDAVMINIRIEGDRAAVVSNCIVTEETASGPVIQTMGRYTDVVVRCPDGRWRFQKRHMERTCTKPMFQVRPLEIPGPAEIQSWHAAFRAELADAQTKREPWREDFKADVSKRKAEVARTT